MLIRYDFNIILNTEHITHIIQDKNDHIKSVIFFTNGERISLYNCTLKKILEKLKVEDIIE